VALASQIAGDQLDVRRIEIVVDPDDFASRRVAMHNGFRAAGMRTDRILHVKDMSILPVDPPNKAIT
jgi:RimJ/RimL family protein N-acetyltransferase